MEIKLERYEYVEKDKSVSSFTIKEGVKNPINGAKLVDKFSIHTLEE